MSTIECVASRLAAIVRGESSAPGVAGAVVGVAVGDEQTSVASGVANLNTGQPFTEDTGWLLGSVTKLFTATILMRLVERGEVDLNAAAKRYVPEFTLRDADAPERITVRMLLNHTNGIDADTLMPDRVRGQHASRSYTEHLPRMGVLFEPGAGLTYSNPGFVLAGRIIEERTGLPFERAIQQELFDPVGMRDATAVQTQALLRRTAVGAHADPSNDALCAPAVFTAPESAAGAGATPIVTVADMLAFGRMHLSGGVAATGTRVLSDELVAAMRSPTYDLGIPQAPPIGLGWWLFPIAGTTAAWHGGGSPGGTSSFCVIPEYDATIASFATGPGAPALHDQLQNAVLEELTGQPVTAPMDVASTAPNGADLEGEYSAFQQRVTIKRDGDELLLKDRFEPYDEEHRQTLEKLQWIRPEQVSYTGVGHGQFAPTAMKPESLWGIFGRTALLTPLPAAPGRRQGLHSGLRYLPKISEIAEG